MREFDQSAAARWMHRLIMNPAWGFATLFRSPLARGLDQMASALGITLPTPSQIRQDLFVVAATRGKKNGFFVEFGATDGREMSNSLLLEQSFGWSGILSEPAPVWHNELKANRRAKIDTRCVWKSSGETIDFAVSDVAVLSTATAFANTDRFHEETPKLPKSA